MKCIIKDTPHESTIFDDDGKKVRNVIDLEVSVNAERSKIYAHMNLSTPECFEIFMPFSGVEIGIDGESINILINQLKHNTSYQRSFFEMVDKVKKELEDYKKIVNKGINL